MDGQRHHPAREAWQSKQRSKPSKAQAARTASSTLSRMMASLTRAPASIFTLGPMLTLGPIWRSMIIRGCHKMIRCLVVKDNTCVIKNISLLGTKSASPGSGQIAFGWDTLTGKPAYLCSGVDASRRVDDDIPDDGWALFCKTRGRQGQEGVGGRGRGQRWPTSVGCQAGGLGLSVVAQVVAVGIDCRAAGTAQVMISRP